MAEHTPAGLLRFQAFLAQRTNLAPGSAEIYIRYARQMAERRQTPMAWLRQNARPSEAQGTLDGKVAAARYVWVWLRTEGKQAQAGEEPKLPGRSHSNPGVQALDEDHLKTYLRVLRDPGVVKRVHVRTILLLAPLTGLTFSSLASAERRRLRRSPVAGGYGLVVGGERGGGTRSAAVWVPFSHDARTILRTYLADSAAQSPSRWLFPTDRVYRGKKVGHVSVRTVELALEAVREDKHWSGVTGQSLRHTMLTRLLEASVPGVVARSLLGLTWTRPGGRRLPEVSHKMLLGAVRALPRIVEE